jgi:hypothetical protein
MEHDLTKDEKSEERGEAPRDVGTWRAKVSYQ